MKEAFADGSVCFDVAGENFAAPVDVYGWIEQITGYWTLVKDGVAGVRWHNLHQANCLHARNSVGVALGFNLDNGSNQNWVEVVVIGVVVDELTPLLDIVVEVGDGSAVVGCFGRFRFGYFFNDGLGRLDNFFDRRLLVVWNR